MPVWKHSTMETAYHSDIVADEDHCEVRIDKNEIVVSYDDDRGPVTYRGHERGPGHYDLRCPQRNGNGNLHRFENDNVLVGTCTEERLEGFWRIILG